MLDGFVIKGNELAQAPVSVTEVTNNALKKRYFTIFFSVLAHLLLGFLLYFFSENQQIIQKETPIKAIKSYLYKRPVKPVKAKPLKAEVKEKVVEIKQAPSKEPVIKREEKQNKIKPKSVSTSAKPTMQAPPKLTAKKPAQASFSAYKQLKNLRSSINKKIMEQELAELQQVRSASVMHGEQIPVPHSNIQLTPEQKREKNTSKLSNDISITKYDNGICTIRREQFLGSPVEGSSSAFACGESKFDKSFREHMKKVQEKLLPVANK